MNIIGLSAYYHDSAACLVQDGKIVAAAQEERFTRKKHDPAFPRNAIDFCLKQGRIGPRQVDYIAFYDKPIVKFDRLLETYLAFAPRGFRSFRKALPIWLNEKLHLSKEMEKGLNSEFQGRYLFTEHHEAHAASAFFPSPYKTAAIMTLDGVGEWATASMGLGTGNRIELTHELHFPHSVGLLYSAMTYFTGFKVNSGEYKLMGLAPYGKPRFKDIMLKELMDLKEDGSFRLNLSYFDYCAGLTMTSDKMADLLEGPPRQAEAKLTQREMDIGASIQAVTEEIMLRSARYLARETGAKHLVMAGGVALNCVGNGKLLRDGCFEDIWIQPAAGDSGGAIGAALFAWHQLLENPRVADDVHDTQQGSLLGPSFTNDQIRTFLDGKGIKHTYFEEEKDLLTNVAEQLVAEKVVGLMQGRMEFGPRALGSRSIIGDARSTKMQSLMNVKIKFRESFRPFAPSVLKERVHEWFQMRKGQESPYMLLVAPVEETKRLPSEEADQEALFGIDLLKINRSLVPSITHVDYSARVQTVDERNGLYYKLIKQFDVMTGCPVIINTSFNIRGEPIVCTPEDAYRCFMACDMDVLVLENCVLYKEDQGPIDARNVEAYKAQFALD